MVWMLKLGINTSSIRCSSSQAWLFFRWLQACFLAPRSSYTPFRGLLGRCQKSLPKKLIMEEIGVPADELSIPHEYLQNAGVEWCGGYWLPYLIYLIPEGVQLKDAFNIAYGNSCSITAMRDEDIAKQIVEQ